MYNRGAFHQCVLAVFLSLKHNILISHTANPCIMIGCRCKFVSEITGDKTLDEMPPRCIMLFHAQECHLRFQPVIFIWKVMWPEISMAEYGHKFVDKSVKLTNVYSNTSVYRFYIMQVWRHRRATTPVVNGGQTRQCHVATHLPSKLLHSTVMWQWTPKDIA